MMVDVGDLKWPKRFRRNRHQHLVVVTNTFRLQHLSQEESEQVLANLEKSKVLYPIKIIIGQMRITNDKK